MPEPGEPRRFGSGGESRTVGSTAVGGGGTPTLYRGGQWRELAARTEPRVVCRLGEHARRRCGGAAINAPMQGTAADLIKLAMIKVQQWLETEELQSKLIMQVHDELVLEVPDDELALVQEKLPGLMCNVADLNVPLLVELGAGKNWDEAH